MAKNNSDMISIIIDTDVGYDDIGALLYLLKHPRIKIHGISISCGITYIEAGVNNVLKLLDYLEKKTILVIPGKEKPLFVNHSFPKKWRERSAQFYGIKLPSTTLQPSRMNLSELIYSVWNLTQEKVFIVGLGPLTNIAQVIQDQTINEFIEGLYIMGGAVDIPGNVGTEYPDIPNFVSEWNFFIDPQAAEIVFSESGIPTTLIPLNATNRVPHTEEFRNKVAKIKRTKEIEIVYQLLNPNVSYFWDELAAVALTNPEIITLENHHINVITEKITHAGWTRSIKNKKPNALVAMDADPLKFELQYIKILNQDSNKTLM